MLFTRLEKSNDLSLMTSAESSVFLEINRYIQKRMTRKRLITHAPINKNVNKLLYLPQLVLSITGDPLNSLLASIYTTCSRPLLAANKAS